MRPDYRNEDKEEREGYGKNKGRVPASHTEIAD
jgi:hypothetical protein